MLYTNEYKTTGLIGLIDVEKAFDTVVWDFLFAALKQFNPDPTFITWIQLLYTNIFSCTTNNGYSKHFPLSSGIRQGCPILALLFILVAEVLSIKLRTNDEIKGIQINGFEYIIVQLADDITKFVSDLKSLEVFINEFLKFKKMSGLKLNLEKCEIIELGSMTIKQSDVPN